MSKKKDDGSSTIQYSSGIWEDIEKYIRMMLDERERTLVNAIKKYDFIVGSPVLKSKLIEVLPEGANIVVVPYINDLTKVYAVKKFDIMDLVSEPYKAEEDERR